MKREEYIKQTSPLPAGYTQLDHIEFTGTQGLYLPDFIFNESDNLYADVMFKTNTTYGSGQPSGFILATTEQSKRLYIFLYENNSPAGWWIYCQQGGVSASPYSSYVNVRNTIIYSRTSFSDGHNTISINAGANNCSKGIRIGYYVNAWPPYAVNYGKMNLNGYIINDSNGNPKLNLMPALRQSDNKPGVYDLVSNTFFTSATGADFLYA